MTNIAVLINESEPHSAQVAYDKMKAFTNSTCRLEEEEINLHLITCTQLPEPSAFTRLHNYPPGQPFAAIQCTHPHPHPQDPQPQDNSIRSHHHHVRVNPTEPSPPIHEYFDGTPLFHAPSVQEMAQVKKHKAQQLVQTFLDQAHKDGFHQPMAHIIATSHQSKQKLIDFMHSHAFDVVFIGQTSVKGWKKVCVPHHSWTDLVQHYYQGNIVLAKD